MKLLLPILLLLLAGCASPNARPTQGVLPSCALYAIADAAEIQYGKPISSEERLRVWRQLSGKQRNGLTLEQAFEAAEKAGWVPADSYLHVAVLNDVALSPLLATLERERHGIVVLSKVGDYVICLDPKEEAPKIMTVKKLEQATGGLYWRVAR